MRVFLHESSGLLLRSEKLLLSDIITHPLLQPPLILQLASGRLPNRLLRCGDTSSISRGQQSDSAPWLHLAFFHCYLLYIIITEWDLVVKLTFPFPSLSFIFHHSPFTFLFQKADIAVETVLPSKKPTSPVIEYCKALPPKAKTSTLSRVGL